MTTFDSTLFRAQFPEFSNDTKYPDVLIEAYWDMATSFISDVDCPCSCLSGKTRALAINMMAAHLLLLGLRASSSSDATQQEQGGFEVSASIGDISVSKLAPPAKDMWQWWLAQTPYGQMLLALLAVQAVGGMMVGGLPERNSFRKVGGVFF